jgi:hypothetical protein
VHAEAFGRGQDHENLAPMLEGAKRNMQAIGKGESYFEGKQLSADSNYHNNENLARCKDEGNAHRHCIRYRVYDIYRASEEDCASCPLRLKCLSRPQTKRRYLVIALDSKKPSLVEEMKAKIDTPLGKKIYSRRLAIVEPVFANIRAQKRLDRFLLRTKTKVDVQWRLFALVHNIEKIQQYGLAN